MLEQELAYHRSFSETQAPKIIEQSSACLRAYAALWRWLRSPEGLNFDEVLKLLGEVNVREVISSSDSLELQILHNLISWISVFDMTSMAPPSLVSDLKRGIKEFDAALDLENKIIWLLRLWKSGNKTDLSGAIAMIKEHRIYGSSDYLLGAFADQLVEKSERGPFSTAAENIRKILLRENEKNEFLTINLETLCIRLPDGQDFIRSEEICVIMQALYFKKSMTFAEIIAAAFKFNFYDSYLHRQKIFNFITKLKQILPSDLILKTKNETLFALGSWDHIHFEIKESLAAILKTSLIWHNIKKTKYSSPTTQKEILKLEKFTRIEFQNLTGQTRSSAHRQLKKLVESKKVTRVGTGKKTYYVSRPPEALTLTEDKK